MKDNYLIIKENIRRIRAEMEETAVKYGRNPEDIQLMAVTKTVPADTVNIAIEQNVALLGENRVQELCGKYASYNTKAAAVHFIGHLQTNKARKIIDLVDMIHSVDSLRLANEINSQAKKSGKIMDALIEINIAGEISKSGVSLKDAESLAREISLLPNLRLRGFMVIPPFAADDATTEKYFSQMQKLKYDIQDKSIPNVKIDVLSMGMSGDYLLAIKHGSTIVRLGSAIFGDRR